MNTKQTITVIGAVSNEVYSVCQNLSKGHYRLILCGIEKQNMEAVAAKIKMKVVGAEVETQDCIIDASWEADIIIVAAGESVKEIAQTIREVANQKIVMIIGGDVRHDEWLQVLPGTMKNEGLQQLLPNSKLVGLCFAASDPDVANQLPADKISALIGGNHKGSVCAVTGLLEEAGCEVIVRDEPVMREKNLS